MIWQMPKRLSDLIKSFWANHGTKILGVLIAVIMAADFLLVEILEVLPVSYRGYVKLVIMGLAYAVIHRGKRNSDDIRGSS